MQKFLVVGDSYTFIKNLELIIFNNVSLGVFEVDTHHTTLLERSLKFFCNSLYLTVIIVYYSALNVTFCLIFVTRL
jgi:hypothetical protein